MTTDISLTPFARVNFVQLHGPSSGFKIGMQMTDKLASGISMDSDQIFFRLRVFAVEEWLLNHRCFHDGVS